MRQFSIYALSINQIVFTSSRRTSSQGEGAGTRVEGGTHTHSSEGGFELSSSSKWDCSTFRCDALMSLLKNCVTFGRFSGWFVGDTLEADLGHVWQLWETEIQFNQSCGKQQHRQKRQQIIALGQRSEGGRERREALDTLRICRMCQKFKERWQEAKKRTHVRVGVLTPVWLALAMGILFLNWPVPFPIHLSPCASFVTAPPSPCCAINLQKVLPCQRTYLPSLFKWPSSNRKQSVLWLPSPSWHTNSFGKSSTKPVTLIYNSGAWYF